MAQRIKVKEYLANEVRMRFSPDSILPYDDNKIIHKLLNSEITTKEAKDAQLLNPNIIKMSRQLLLNQNLVTQTPDPAFDLPLTKEIMADLGVLPTKEDFQKIREKDINLCLVGYGGAMVNMLHNMYLWSMEVSEVRLFKNIVIFEKDTVDFSNLVRFGKPLSFDYTAEFATFPEDDVPNIKTLKKVSMISHEKELSKKKKIISFVEWLADTHARTLKDKDYIIVGAPDLETRKMLVETDSNFYFMGHSDYEVDITYQPEITSGLVVENYGSIDIPVLLINLQIATGAFIKHLAGTGPNLETPDRNQNILSFNMKDYLVEKGAIDV